jgi:hypothetical protein
MRSIRYVAIIALAGTAAACAVRPGVMDYALPQGAQWTATLVPTNGGTLHGTVKFVRSYPETSTRVLFNLAGGSGGAVHPWHVHYGVCGDDHMIVGNPANFPPFVLGSTGSLTAAVQLPVQLDDKEKYVVHIHASAMDMTTIACGELVPDRAIATR